MEVTSSLVRLGLGGFGEGFEISVGPGSSFRSRDFEDSIFSSSEVFSVKQVVKSSQVEPLDFLFRVLRGGAFSFSIFRVLIIGFLLH